MKAPFDVKAFVRWVLSLDPRAVIHNDQILKQILHGASHREREAWVNYLRGPIVSTGVTFFSKQKAAYDIAFVSMGVGSTQWKLYSVADAHAARATMNILRMDGHFQTALSDIKAIMFDERAPAEQRNQAGRFS